MPHGGTLVLGMAKHTSVTQHRSVPVWGTILPQSWRDAEGTMVGCEPERARHFAAPKISMDFG